MTAQYVLNSVSRIVFSRVVYPNDPLWEQILPQTPFTNALERASGNIHKSVSRCRDDPPSDTSHIAPTPDVYFLLSHPKLDIHKST
jgi:hypothetical protein